ncbi:hypothetical protein CFBP5877_06155 [Agrobacterium tumefaciens]|uniref:Uncharacterized protein n=1 Tax=Agrobacterium tumefaciens TaxID=358 RepID=A0AAE6EFX8_AGRTU|nr:hypothetical protein CFBP5499_06625 [Agrobacterium tumefaciens]QCL80270.1 hypothetical protein CFBP5877_06155 [Agrobacterium tumefaciens]
MPHAYWPTLTGLENRTLTCLDKLPLPSKHLTVA